MKKVIIYALVALGVFTLIISNLGTCSWGNPTTSTSTTDEDTEVLTNTDDEDVSSDLEESDFDDEDGDYDIEDTDGEEIASTDDDDIEDDDEDEDLTVVGDDDETDVVLATNTSSDSNNSTVNSGSASGSFLVVTGSFRMEENAQALAKKLKKRGYTNAEVVIFDYSEFYSVVAGRSNSVSDANNLKGDLDSDGIESYVHKMRSKYFK